jgi:hypothetical protein
MVFVHDFIASFHFSSRVFADVVGWRWVGRNSESANAEEAFIGIDVLIHLDGLALATPFPP